MLERKGKSGCTCYVKRPDYLREDFSVASIAQEYHDSEGNQNEHGADSVGHRIN